MGCESHSGPYIAANDTEASIFKHAGEKGWRGQPDKRAKFKSRGRRGSCSSATYS